MNNQNESNDFRNLFDSDFDIFINNLRTNITEEDLKNKEIDYKEEYYKLLRDSIRYFNFVDDKLGKIECRLNAVEFGHKQRNTNISKEAAEKTKKMKEETELKMSLIKSIKTPKDIKKTLDEYVIGQEEAKRIVSQSVFNHLEINYNASSLPEQHLMLIGPSGCGKTEIFRALKDAFHLNIHIFDVSHISFSGYAACGGQHLSDILRKVKDGDIVVFDEFDKILLKNIERRSDGNLLQSEFLKLLEGEFIECKNCLFVFLGAFSKITDKEEISQFQSFGFLTSETVKEKKENLFKQLVQIGIYKEILGRITYVSKLKKLDERQFLKVIKNEKSIYYTYRNYFLDSYCLEINLEDDLLIYLINEAFENDLGVRGLNAKIADCFSSILYKFEEIKESKSNNLEKNLINLNFSDYEFLFS